MKLAVPPTSFADAALAVVDVDPDDGDDGHEGERHAADVREAVARPHHQPRQHQHRRQREAVQQLQEARCVFHA